WSLLIIFVYWMVWSVGRGQATRGRMSPFLGIWAANLVMLGWIAVQSLRHSFSRTDDGGLLTAPAGWARKALLWLVRRISRAGTRTGTDETAGTSRAPWGL